MSGRGPAFVDTNVLVYAFEKKPSPHKIRARQLVLGLLETDQIRLSSQILQEFYVTLTRKSSQPATPDEALLYLDHLSQWPLLTLHYGIIREAALLARDAVLSFWDALIVIAAAWSGASVLYTEDMNHGQEIVGVRIINPFRDLKGSALN